MVMNCLIDSCVRKELNKFLDPSVQNKGVLYPIYTKQGVQRFNRSL